MGCFLRMLLTRMMVWMNLSKGRPYKVNKIEAFNAGFDKFIESKMGCVLGWIWFCLLIISLATELLSLV